MERKAIILSRVSSMHQNLEQQTEAVLRAVHSDGYKDSNIIIIEDKESAIKLSEEERKGLNKMKEHIENDPSIKAVYLYELSRLSRRQLDLFKMKEYLSERHIQLVCIKPYFRLLDDDGNVSQMGSLAFAMFSTFSETEMELKKERMMRGRRYNRSLGKHSGGRTPFGYTTNKEKFYIIHPQNAEIIKRVFSEYVNDRRSMFVIAKGLKEDGLFPNTNIFSLFHCVDYWLSRDIYVGSPMYPQIISKTMFERAKKERDAHKRGPKKTHKNIFLLKGLIFDGDNGLPMFGERGMQSYCDTHGGGHCIKYVLVDPLIWDFSKKMYHKYVMNKTIYKRQLQKDLQTISKRVETIREELQSLRDKIDKVEERIIFGKLSEKRGAELTDKLSEQLNEKEHRLLELTNESIGKQQQLMEIDFKDDLNENSLTLDEKIAIVKRIVKKVVINRPGSRSIAHISIFNRINDNVVVYEINSNPRVKHKGWVKINEYNRKDKH